MEDFDHDATYSPEDNKLRLYPAYRLDKEDYNLLRSKGFKWAPKQELFVAPMWTPYREDILLEMCGEIGDEDTSLVDRAGDRADRFQDYSHKRAEDANTAKEGVDAITKYIPFGQPILVGHHSERRARKDAERIENGMRKAVKMWETSEYWKYRAAGALRHAKHKEIPAVRARRIKKIEAEKRKQEKIVKESKSFLNFWLHPSILTRGKALYVTNFSYSSFCFTLDEYPREPPISQYEGDMGLWGALDHGIITAKQARNLHVPRLEETISNCDRWINHCNNRLEYEKAMLGEQGESDLLKPKPRPKQLPLLNYRIPDGIEIENSYHKNEFIHYTQADMTKAEYKDIYRDYKGTEIIENSHRIRTTMQNHSFVCIFLTDSKVHKKPEPVEPEPRKAPAIVRTQSTYTPPERTEFDDMKDTLKVGVKVVSAPQLFPTPKELAEKMADICDVSEGESVLEPSAGTGILLGSVGCKWHGTGGRAVAVEVNQELCTILKREFPLTEVLNKDFLTCNGDLLKFDKIIMNPPFEKGQDIKHIEHALTFLKPGGRLVALCADGPRQRERLMPLGEWESLPQGSFKASGTMVSVAMLTIDN